jgi:hypothetical protein
MKNIILLSLVLDGKAFSTGRLQMPRFWAAGEIPFNYPFYGPGLWKRIPGFIRR